MRKIYVVLILSFLVIFFAGSELLAGKKISPEKHKKIGVLVLRMGNARVYSPLANIGLKTDYSLRNYTRSRNVYIDDEKRLRETIPNYPIYPASKKGNVILFFKNFSTEMTKGIIDFFQGRGFDAIPFRSMAEENGVNFSEMTVSNILDACQGKLDALFILHYLDIGSVLIESRNLDVKNRGFTSMVYTSAIFDITRKKRIFKYSPLLGISIKGTLIHDSRIMNNPKNKEKINIICTEKLGEIVTEVSYNFKETELIQQLVTIIIHGLNCPKKPLSKCHKHLNCFSIKGILTCLE